MINKRKHLYHGTMRKDTIQICLFVLKICLACFRRSWLVALIKLKSVLLKGPITIAGNAERHGSSVFCSFVQDNYSQQKT